MLICRYNNQLTKGSEMKKVLIASTIAACCSMAYASPDVQVYGLVNVGMSYVHSNPDAAGLDSNNSFTMENGQAFGSRFGLRGSEDLGNGLKIGFVLESGIEADSGSLDVKQSTSRIFGRESSVTLSGDFGAVSFGRMPIFGSVLGANGLFRAIDPINANYTSAIGSGYASASMWTRVDNAVSYKTPTFAGLTGYAMYSFKNDSVNDKTNEEGSSDAERYASAALRYQNGALEAVFVADTTMWSNAVENKGMDDGVTLTLGGNYTFDNQLKVIAFYQYFDSQKLNVNARGGVAAAGINEIAGGYGFVDGWGASVGVNYPLGGGTIRASVNYRDMSNEDDVDFTRWTVAGAYDYDLSKRTSVYVMGGYSEEKVESAAAEGTPSGAEVAFGMIHKF